MTTTAVFVCRKCKGHDALVDALGDCCPDVRVREVGCQKVCSKSVVGVRGAAGLQWLKKIDTGKKRKALCHYVADGGPLPKRLRKLVVRKREGQLR